ncbi:MAG: hypothetical protein ACJ76J_09305 [Thermoanaerobaculia bacterium]
MTTKLLSGRACTFEKVPMFLLANYFVLTFPHEPSNVEAGELFTIALRYGREQSNALANKPDAFVLIHSGHAARRSQGWHLHVVVIRSRIEKAWLYFLLSGKNALHVVGIWKSRVVQQGAPADTEKPRA